MAPILGRPVLAYCLERIRAVPSVSRVAVATSLAPADDAIADYCRREGVEVFRGDEDHVLDRVWNAVKSFPEEHFLKFWGDSPLIDPKVCQEAVERFEQDFADCDYFSNNHPSTYPEGMQLEIIRKEALGRAARAGGVCPTAREHVTPCLWRNPGLFKTGNLEAPQDLHDRCRIALDHPEDMEQIRRLLEALYPQDPLFDLAAIMDFLDRNPEVKALNQMHYETEKEYHERIFQDGGDPCAREQGCPLAQLNRTVS